jgi:hypothetical protein
MSSMRRRRMPATSSHRRCRSGRRPSVSSSSPSCEQPACGQRSAPTAGEGPSTPTASPWAAAGLGLDTERARASSDPKQN